MYHLPYNPFRPISAPVRISAMVWGRDKSKSNEDVKHVRDEPRPDFSKPLPRETLPKDLQAIVDQDDDDLDTLYSQ